MNVKANSPTQTMIFFVAGLLFTIFVFLLFVWPSFLTLMHGACWSNVNTILHDIDRDFESLKIDTKPTIKKTLTLGDCVGEFIFTNKREHKTVANEVSCNSGFTSMIIAIPSFNGLEGLEKDIKGVKAICRQIPCKDDSCFIEGGPIVLNGPENDESVKEHCVGILKKSLDIYFMVSREGDCSEVGSEVDTLLSAEMEIK